MIGLKKNDLSDSKRPELKDDTTKKVLGKF